MVIFHTHCQEILSLFAATLDVLGFGYSVFICCYSLIKKKNQYRESIQQILPSQFPILTHTVWFMYGL